MAGALRLALLLLFSATTATFAAEGGRVTIGLNGVWDFQQTNTAAVPRVFNHKIPVPGLVHMAEPKLDQCDLFFSPARQDGKTPFPTRPAYEPRYNWYRRLVQVPKELEGQEAVLSILKSQFVTQVFVNGMDAGSSMACFTPLDMPVTSFLRYGEANEILIRVGDHRWLPSAAPGGLDGEKVNYTPGIWDDVQLTFSGRFRIHRALVLPSLKKRIITVKLLVQCLSPARTGYGVPLMEPFSTQITIRERSAGKSVAAASGAFQMRGGKIAPVELEVPIESPHSWTPEDPFLYTAEVTLVDSNKTSDRVEKRFGMRDFERSGKYFSLNGKRVMLRGSNITLHRFLNDPDCGALPWNREWVHKLLAEIPRKLHWNAMRVSVGILPQFWYDIADEAGLMLQNEWMYWGAHGWDEQARAEFTDWVWADGSHPSIVIWDAMNEHEDNFIGNVLIPELKRLDPTRIWDNGYMTTDDYLVNVHIPNAQRNDPTGTFISPNTPPMNITWDDDMDETHPYLHQVWRRDFDKWTDEDSLRIGDLNYWSDYPRSMDYHSAAQVVNEYGWIWLWRNGMPSPHSPGFYQYYLGTIDNVQANRELQAYDLQWETELFRTHESVAGVMAFAYLTNNYGATGDWFVDNIKDLKPSPTLLWFRHCFAPSAVFIDLADHRYDKHPKPYQPGASLVFNLIGVNDQGEEVNGAVTLRFLNEKGQEATKQSISIAMPAYSRQPVPVELQLPKAGGGYLLAAEFREAGGRQTDPVISRRYIKVGDSSSCSFYELKP